MGDEAVIVSIEKNNEPNNKENNDLTIKVNNKLNIAKRVSPAIRRLVHLGCDFGPYRAHNYHARGISSVEPLGFNFLKAWCLDIFSEQMSETFLHKNKDAEKEEEDLEEKPAKELERVPKGGWPDPDVVEIARNLLLDDGGACRPAAIFILAACCRTQGPACPAAYSFVKVMDNPDDLLLFIKYAMDLTAKRRGWGAGLRRAVKAWYLDRYGAMELAEQITRYKQRHCWSHKDVLKQIHAKPKNKVQAMVLTYAMFGVEKANEILKSIPKEDSMRKEAEEVMVYLEGANALRKLQIPKGADVDCPQVKKAVELIKTHCLYLEHCDDTMYVAPAVWEAVLERMPFWQLLIYLPLLRFNRILKSGDELNKVVLISLKRAYDALTKYSGEKVHPPVSPALVLISMQTYRRKNSETLPSKLWVSTKDGVVTLRNPPAIREGVSDKGVGAQVTAVRSRNLPNKNANRLSESADSTESIRVGFSQISGLGHIHYDRRLSSKLPKEIPKPNPKTLELLSKILVASIKSVCPTGKRFIFGVGNVQDKSRCMVNPYVMTYEAAALIFMCLEASEADGTVRGYSVPVEGSPCKRLRSAGLSVTTCSREIMQGMSTNPIKVDSWVAWLCHEKFRADVLVLMADGVICEKDSGDKLLDALKKYRKDLKLPRAKLVLVSLNIDKFPQSSSLKEDDSVLMVYGFDSHLPFIIQRFARDEF